MTIEYPVREWIPVVYGDSVFHNTVTQIMSHPSEAVTQTELHYFAPSTENDVIDNAVSKLISVGILQEIGTEPLIGFTEEGKQFIVDSRLYRGASVLKSVYTQTELTDEVREAADIARPDWYLEEIASGDFKERDEVRDTDAFDEGWSRVMYNTKLTIKEANNRSELHAVFERSQTVQSGDNAEDFDVLCENTYSLSQEEQDALQDVEVIQDRAVGTEGIMNASSEVDEYNITFDAFVGESDVFSPSYDISVNRKSGSTVLSLYLHFREEV